MPGPYRWTDPVTWVDSTVYTAAQLTAQIVTNVQEVPHLLGVLQEDVVDETSLNVQGEYYKPVFPELTVPLGTNQTWYFLEVIRWSGVGTPSTDQTRFGWYTPLGTTMQGTGPTINGSGNAALHVIDLNYTGATQLEWESQDSIPEHETGTNWITWMEFYVTTTTTAGNLECGFSTINEGVSSTVYAGTCLMGMKVAP